MIWHEDKTRLTVIDFEYSGFNFRGYDIGAYLNECFIDYSHPTGPKFKIYYEQMTAFLTESTKPGSELEQWLTAYLR